ncbi:acyl-CoA thioesterase [Glaciecola sp. MH2013]|uniref:acyl-CoA thioesterase n=1 Tax=Glaciecola sp. MH2013 TaxID=2785524 RepID=UPI00189F93A3|nr:acyl-CoA thioesterase [Glaciecola sp. MH2013]MBF7072514.1 acyl-CoA thioesterase [Glaciecola sp. MH2013]
MEPALTSLAWELEAPFVDVWKIEQQHIDHYKHVNNVAYVSQLEKLAWKHSNKLGLSMQDYKEFDRGMVIQQHVLNYHFAAHLGDEIACATWIASCDNKFRLSRAFQFISLKTLKTVFSAQTQFVCVSLSKGSPKRMPAKFIEIYGQAAKLSNPSSKVSSSKVRGSKVNSKADDSERD